MGELRMVAELMAISARTAPKAVGKDFIVTKIVEGDDLQQLAEKMYEFGERTGKGNFDRDGANVSSSAAVLLIGLKDAEVVGLNCSACGSEKCIKPDTFEGRIQGPQLRLAPLGHGHRHRLGRQDSQPLERGQPHHVPRRRGSPRDGPH